MMNRAKIKQWLVTAAVIAAAGAYKALVDAHMIPDVLLYLLGGGGAAALLYTRAPGKE